MTYYFYPYLGVLRIFTLYTGISVRWEIQHHTLDVFLSFLLVVVVLVCVILIVNFSNPVVFYRFSVVLECANEGLIEKSRPTFISRFDVLESRWWWWRYDVFSEFIELKRVFWTTTINRRRLDRPTGLYLTSKRHEENSPQTPPIFVYVCLRLPLVFGLLYSEEWCCLHSNRRSVTKFLLSIKRYFINQWIW